MTYVIPYRKEKVNQEKKNRARKHRSVTNKPNYILEGEGHVSKGSTPFILIVGSFKFDQVVEILDGFLNKVRRER